MRLTAETWVSRRRDEVFPFFADAANLEQLTPPWLNFAIRTPLPIAMHPGREITYRITLRGWPMQWVSRITAYEPPSRFIDEQLQGPYRIWRHEHRFVEAHGGTLLRDEVEFDMFAAALVGGFVARELRKIFAYRHETLLSVFEQPKPWPAPNIQISR